MKKSVLSTILTILFVSCATCSNALALDANALPNVVGSVNVTNTIDSASHTLTSVVNGGTGAVGQNDMTGGLGSNSTWNINATGHSQTFLGRFVDGNLTQLNGRINTGCAASGCGYGNTLKVILTNPYGIVFGNGSQVNANSFTVSTFDPIGAKNIKNMTAAELENYKAGLTSKFGPNVNIVFEGGNATDGAAVTLNNSTWNIDKSAAIVAKDINIYKGSKISTNLNYNYGTPANQNFSNLKLVTSDGVTFKYVANGYINNNSVAVKDAKSNVNYKINIGDKNSSNATDATLSSGSIQVINKGTTDASKININKSAIKGYKLINNAYGDIYLVGNDVDINNSLIETCNTYEVEKPANNTHDKTGGTITIDTNKGLNIKNSNLATAYSTVADDAGDIILNVSKTGNLNLEGTTVNSKGSVFAIANDGKVTTNDTILSGRNKAETGLLEDVVVYGTKGIDINDTYVDASNNATIQSTKGNITISNSGKINADNQLSIIGKNSLIDNSNVTYKELALHDGTNTNNVTIKNATTLKDKDSTSLVVDVKGNLVVDNNSLKANNAGEDYSKAVNQNKITLKSTGDITIQNNSDITATTDIIVDAAKNANITNSKLTAKNNVITAAANNINLDKAKIKATNKNTLNAKDDVDSECSEVTGVNNDIVAQNGAVTLKNTAVTATADNTVTAKTNVKTANVRIKGDNNTITAKTGNLEIVNTDLVANKTNKTVANNGNVTFRYDKALKEACTGNGCIDVVTNNGIKGKDNVITADKGDVEITGAVITATDGDNTITAPTGSIKLKDVKLNSENDNKVVAADDVETDCVEMDAKNNIITATNGKITMKDTEARAVKNNTITANKDIKTSNVRVKGATNSTLSKTGNIDLVNTQYIATTKNSIVANNGNVTFKYDNNLKEICADNKCIAVVEDTSIKGPENIITGKDVDANLIIKPVDPSKPEETITKITGDNVTTGARVIYDDLYDITGTIVGDGQLDTGRTKVTINSPGNVNLVLKNTNNPKAGLEINAPKVEIKTRDGELSISKIYADELYLDKDEKFIAGETTITNTEKAIDSYAPTNPESLQTQAGFDAQLPGRAYIEVKNGFNFDYEPSQVAVSGIYQGSFNEIKDAQGNIIGYGKHYITLDSNSTEGQFLLSYNKPFACEPEPPVIVDDTPLTGYVADQTTWTRLPLQADIVGQVGDIANGITDPSSGMIAAAAEIDVEDIDQE